jgi:hypothetical protein
MISRSDLALSLHFSILFLSISCTSSNCTTPSINQIGIHQTAQQPQRREMNSHRRIDRLTFCARTEAAWRTLAASLALSVFVRSDMVSKKVSDNSVRVSNDILLHNSVTWTLRAEVTTSSNTCIPSSSGNHRESAAIMTHFVGHIFSHQHVGILHELLSRHQGGMFSVSRCSSDADLYTSRGNLSAAFFWSHNSAENHFCGTECD